MSECYNTGKITVNTKNGFTNVGGVSYCGTKIKNCYNTGTVSLTGKGYAGGVVGEFRDGSCNYNVGKVTAKGKYAMAGEIAGYVSGKIPYPIITIPVPERRADASIQAGYHISQRQRKFLPLRQQTVRNCHQSTGPIPASIRDLS